MNFTRFVGKANRNPHYRQALRSRSTRKMDLRPSEGNLTLDFTMDGSHLDLPMTPLIRDFIDLAAMIYVADELDSRESTADRWTRTFQAVLPVRAPRLWESASQELQDLLYFLSGDRYQFEWVRTKVVPPLRGHRATLPHDFDLVCLFSGGVDSLLGAYDLLKSGKRVLLVGHQADKVTSSIQKNIFKSLKKQFGDHVHFVQALVARSRRANPEFALGDKVETSHRTRSFLFLSIAVAVAAAAEIDRIAIPENGLIALNPPLDISRIGTLSTRTAHPRFISGFRTFAARVKVFQGVIYNPFLYLSKTDVVQGVPQGLHALLGKTMSCSHLGRDRFTGFLHCGYCVPCLYRRVAFHTLGLDAPGDYFRDVFSRFRSLTANERGDIRALIRFARRIQAMTPAQRRGTVLQHGSCDREVLSEIGPAVPNPYDAWDEMLLRWTKHFLETSRAWMPRDVQRRMKI